jgi:hypothetical protein
VKTHYDALDRTTLLLNEEWFAGEADEHIIADALLASTIRLVADEQFLSCRAGQAAFVSAFMLVARLGIGLELQAPEVPLLDQVAPLRLPGLVEALVELGSDLVPGARVRTVQGEVGETFVFGEAPHEDYRQPVRVIVRDFETDLKRGGAGAPCNSEVPLGGFAAGAALAAIALDVTRGSIEEATGLQGRTPRPLPGPPVQIRLQEMFPELSSGLTLNLGHIDIVSGGAITHALLFCLLRIPEVRAQVRVIELQDADISNVNRYSLLRASHENADKVEILEMAASERIEVTGVKTLFTKETRGVLLPLAERVLVGVDDIEARWWVQEVNPRWIAVGATSNNLAQLTTHVPGGPCAACSHPVSLLRRTIPTISFVSFWAGLLQACALLTGSRAQHMVSLYPFALGGPSPVTSVPSVANRKCPIKCPASRAS